MVGTTFVPAPKATKVSPQEIEKMAPKLGQVNIARVGQNPFLGAIEAEIDENGYQEQRGPRPWIEEGFESFGDGNGRMTALVNCTRRHPDKFKNLRVTVDIYPSLTEEQRHALIHRAARSTAPFTEKDYYKHSMARWKSHPGESQLEHLKGMGLEFAMLFFTPAPEAALLRTKNAKGETVKVELKPGVTSDDLWGKGKGGQKQGPVQVGSYLAEAHPRAVEAFFDSWGEDKAHSISYRELIETVTQWKEDKKLRPDLATPPVSFQELAERMIDKGTGECVSSLVKGVLGARIKDGKEVQGGRDKGKGRMDQKAAGALSTTLGSHDDIGPIILARHERTAGHTSEEGLRDLETVLKCARTLREASVVKKDGTDFLEGAELQAVLVVIRDAQRDSKAAIARIHSRAAAEAAASQKAVIEAEAAKARKQKV